MDRNGRMGGKRREFDRIVALLLALADLAERSAHAPRPVRWLVLWALQQADMVAREFVADHSRAVVRRYWSPAVVIVRYGADPADAINLALSLRMLAHGIRTIVEQTSRLSLARLGEVIGACGSDGMPGRTAGAILGLLSVAAITRLDTS